MDPNTLKQRKMQDQRVQSTDNEQRMGKSQETPLWNRIKNQFASKPSDKEQSDRRKQSGAPLIYIANAPDMDNGVEIQQQANGSKARKQQRSHTHVERYLSPNAAPPSPRLSKSDQMLSRLLKDQLQLAYSDHQNNVRSAQSHEALEHLRNSQPRLELTPSSSRHASPCRGSRSQNHSPLLARKSHSPVSHLRHYDTGGGSSGSENSYSSNMSAPPSYMQLSRSKSCTPSRTHSPAKQQERLLRERKESRYASQTNSPTYSPMHSNRTSRHQQRNPVRPVNGGLGIGAGTSDLVKNAHINLLWAFILDAVRTGQLEHFDSGEPKQWWRKLFQTLKQLHGKGKKVCCVVIYVCVL